MSSRSREATPWETIQSFRHDPDSKQKLACLRAWTISLGSAEDPRIVRDQIEASIVEYTEHMRLHKLLYSTATLEVVVTGAADLIEDLTRLRLGSAVRRVFALRQSKVKLLQGGAAAPGRALAYLMKAQHGFKET